MAKYRQVLGKILEGRSDASIAFNDLRRLLKRMGFEERVRGSHHIFRRKGVEELINLQRHGKDAKIYQIRQVRAIIHKYSLELDD
jgi:predicted RNA binding protein YcfA (HicA-like mRNA interferase family)